MRQRTEKIRLGIRGAARAGWAWLLLSGCAAVAPVGPLRLGDDGRLALDVDGRLGLQLTDVSFRVRADGAWVESADCAPPVLRADAAATRVSYRCDAAGLTLEVAVQRPAPGAAGLVLAPVVRGCDDPACAVEVVELRVAPGGLQLPELAESVVFLQNGYQSWSFSGALRLDAPFAAEADDELRYAAASGDVLRERLGVGWWFGALAAGSHTPALAVGAVTARRLRTAIVPQLTAGGQAGLTVRVGTAGEAIPAEGAEGIAFERLAFVGGAAVEEALDAYARLLGESTPALADRSGIEPTGWWSWNELFDDVTEERVLAHADLLQRELADAGFGLVVLDDGYMERWGDWEQTDPARFPSGLAALAAEVRRRGLDVGLWLAPFLVDEGSALVTEHPEWFVRDAAGAPLVHNQLGLPGPTRVLDPTHPQAAEHLRALFARLAAAGFALLKLDFLYAAALPGQRQRRAATGIEALNAGLELIRESAPGAHLNLCGMPVLPAVGRGHSLRTGPDIAFKGLPISFTHLAHEARNAMARAVLDPLVRNDPDQVLARAPLTLDEARAAATLGALTGFFAAGDDLTALPAERRAVLAHPALREIARHGRSARPLELFGAAGDRLYVTPLIDPGLGGSPRTALPSRFFLQLDGDEAYLALFNWEGGEQRTAVDLSALGFAAAEVTELWREEALAVADRGALALTVPAHAVALLRLRRR